MTTTTSVTVNTFSISHIGSWWWRPWTSLAGTGTVTHEPLINHSESRGRRWIFPARNSGLVSLWDVVVGIIIFDYLFLAAVVSGDGWVRHDAVGQFPLCRVLLIKKFPHKFQQFVSSFMTTSLRADKGILLRCRRGWHHYWVASSSSSSSMTKARVILWKSLKICAAGGEGNKERTRGVYYDLQSCCRLPSPSLPGVVMLVVSK